jgi:hypothetical protein
VVSVGGKKGGSWNRRYLVVFLGVTLSFPLITYIIFLLLLEDWKTDRIEDFRNIKSTLTNHGFLSEGEDKVFSAE